VPRHVVILTRDTSLAIALKALLGNHDRLTEIDSPNGWRALNGSPVDAVVVDLPRAPRKAAVEALKRKFTGPLIILLDPGEELAMTIDQQRCSTLQRPFGLSELWTLLVSPPPEATQDVPPERPSATETERSVLQSAPVVERPVSAPPEPAAPWSDGGPPESEPSWIGQGTADVPEPAWRWRFRRFQQVPKPSEAGELTEPMPRVEPDGNGAAADEAATAEIAPAVEVEVPAAAEVEAPAAEAASTDVTGEGDAEAAAVEAPVDEIEGAAGADGEDAEAPAAEIEAPAVDATSADVKVRVAAAPPAAPVSDTAVGGIEPAISLMDTTMWHEADEAPQAVTNRLARRLRLDVVALLLDNGQGLLDTAGGVGLKPAERRLQVEYGHDVLRELFRVGVGLIDDTARVRGILSGIPFGQADTLMMVPLAYEGHGFGVLLAGRYRREWGIGEPEFTEHEIEALMDFAEDVAPALRSAILLRRLKGQLNLAQGQGP
jgi:hypothetical protein